MFLRQCERGVKKVADDVAEKVPGTPSSIAEWLLGSLDDAMEAHRMLDLALTDTDAPDHYCTAAEREVQLELPCLALHVEEFCSYASAM
jgi:hypothetical protein